MYSNERVAGIIVVLLVKSIVENGDLSEHAMSSNCPPIAERISVRSQKSNASLNVEGPPELGIEG